MAAQVQVPMLFEPRMVSVYCRIMCFVVPVVAPISPTAGVIICFFFPELIDNFSGCFVGAWVVLKPHPC